MVGLVVAVLAVGIGATTAVFSAVDAVLLQPVPFADADRLVTVWQQSPESDRRRTSRPRTTSTGAIAPAQFEILAAAEPYSRDYTGGPEPEVFRAHA